jgi:glycosyltransferase involved in cell wall biosynthesis
MNDIEIGNLKVVVSAHGRWHAFELAGGLHQHGILSRLLTTYPASVATKFLPHGVPLVTAPLLELRRRLYDKFKIGGKPDLEISKAFGRFASRHAIGEVGLLVGWSSATLEAILPAQEVGIKVVIERGSSHIEHQTAILTQAYQEFGINFTATHPEIIEREKQEYDLADAIAVPTQFAAQTFISRGLGNKLIVNPYGVDLKRFSTKVEYPTRKKKRIIFVGGVGIRKGVPWLLRAFKGLADQAELHLIGNIEKGFEQVLAKESLEGVKIRGAVASKNLPNELHAADIFCLPSLEEGFPLSMLEAMACGLPIVTTLEAGAKDIIRSKVEGLIVPARDVRSLNEALELLLLDSEARENMGLAARSRVEQGFSWDDYIHRAISGYRNILSGKLANILLAFLLIN